MPRVSYVDVTIRGQLVRVDIHYNSKEMFHVKIFDKEVKEMLMPELKRFKTEDQLVKVIKDVLFEFHRIKSTIEKVIVFKVCASDAIVENKDPDGYGGKRKRWAKNLQISQIYGDDLFAFGLEWQVAFRVHSDGTKYYQPKKKRQLDDFHEEDALGHSFDLDDESSVIAWTAEREDALNVICESLSEMAKKAILVLTNADKTLKMLDTKQKLLQ